MVEISVLCYYSFDDDFLMIVVLHEVWSGLYFGQWVQVALPFLTDYFIYVSLGYDLETTIFYSYIPIFLYFIIILVIYNFYHLFHVLYILKLWMSEIFPPYHEFILEMALQVKHHVLLKDLGSSGCSKERGIVNGIRLHYWINLREVFQQV